MKMKIFAVVLILVLSTLITAMAANCIASSAVPGQSKPDAAEGVLKPLDGKEISFYGTWKINRVAGYGRVSAGEETGRRSLGEKVSFGPEDAFICNKQIKPVYYYRINIAKDDFFRIYWVAAESLGINGPIVEIIVLSESDRLHKDNWRVGYSFAVKDDKSILVNSENVWFELVREN